MGLLDDLLTGRARDRRRMETEIARAIAAGGRVENLSEKGIQLRVPEISAGRLGAATALERTTGMVDPAIFSSVEDITAFPQDSGMYEALSKAGITEGSSLKDLAQVLGGLSSDGSGPGGGNRAADENGGGRSRVNMVDGFLEGYMPTDTTLSNFMQLQAAVDENLRLMNLMLNSGIE